MHESNSSSKGTLSRLKYGVAGVLGYCVILAVGRTMRLVGWSGRRLDAINKAGERVIVAFWHNKLFYMSYCIAAHYIQRGGGIAVLISASRDGEYMARVAGRLGAMVERGSSTRMGSAGFRRLCRHAKRGASLCVAPDGPKGPRYEVKEGVVYLAQKTGLPILPVSYRAKSTVTFKSWDGFVLPLPFTDVEVRCGEPMRVPADSGSMERKDLCVTLRNQLMDLE